MTVNLLVFCLLPVQEASRHSDIPLLFKNSFNEIVSTHHTIHHLKYNSWTKNYRNLYVLTAPSSLQSHLPTPVYSSHLKTLLQSQEPIWLEYSPSPLCLPNLYSPSGHQAFLHPTPGSVLDPPIVQPLTAPFCLYSGPNQSVVNLCHFSTNWQDHGYHIHWNNSH